MRSSAKRGCRGRAQRHRPGVTETAFVLDFDLHYGDGNVNILGNEPWVEILNPEFDDRRLYLEEVEKALKSTRADVIAVSAGFDNHVNDWGRQQYTADYKTGDKKSLSATCSKG